MIKPALSIIITAVLFLSGCATSPLTRYADFPEKKKLITSTCILTDYVLLEAVSEDTNKINISESRQYAKTSNDYFAGRLNEKNYHVEKSLVTSVGLLLDPKAKNKVVNSIDEEETGVGTLPYELPPYYMHEIFKRDTILVQLLKIVYSSLVGYEKTSGDIGRKIPAATYLGKALGSDIMAFVFAVGYDAPVSYRLGVQHVIPDIRASKMLFEPVTQFTLMFYLVDSKEGEVVWDDKVVLKGGTVNKEKLETMINKIVSELP
jgi:hypothetical protein